MAIDLGIGQLIVKTDAKMVVQATTMMASFVGLLIAEINKTSVFLFH